MPRKLKQRENNTEYLIRNGWYRNDTCDLWRHPDPGVTGRVDGMPWFTSEAVEIQRRRDRREAE